MSKPAVYAAAAAVAVAGVAVLCAGLPHAAADSRPRPPPLVLSCACGRVSGTLRPHSPLRLLCYCDDCQAYAAWLKEQQPGSAVVVDEHGGQAFVQCFRADVALDEGCAELLQATKQAPRPPASSGPPTGLLRLHATCCGAPMFCVFASPPALALAAPHVSVCVSALPGLRGCGGADADAAAEEEAKRASALGPIVARLNARFAVGGPAALQLLPGGGRPAPAPSPGFGPSFLLTFVLRQLRFRARRAPDPFPAALLADAVVRE